MGQQASDGLDGVAYVLAAAEVAGQDPPVQWAASGFRPKAPNGGTL